MKMTDQTCEQKIDGRLKDRLEGLLPDFGSMTIAECKGILNDYGYNHPAPDSDLAGWGEAARECFHENIGETVIEVSLLKTYKVLLSTGGPEDFFELQHDGSGWTGGRYFFKDWVDSASRPISAETAERLAETWGIGPDYE
jgi:hypothetical protein